MRILLLTQLFQPEPNHLKGLSFAKALVELGHDVEVLTGFPNYPEGRIYPGYKQEWQFNENLDGIPIVRVPLFPDHTNSGFRRFICYISLAVSTCLGIFRIRKPDVVHVYQGPATIALAAMMLRLFQGIPYVLDIQDLWPDSVLNSGMLKFPMARFWLTCWCRLTYALAHKIVVLSQGYKSVLVDRGAPANKIAVVYNWCEETQMLSHKNHEDSEDPFGLSNRFNVVYAGNIGRMQALDVMIHAAKSFNDTDVQFVLVGNGVDDDRLKRLVQVEKISNVKFIPRQPIDRIGGIIQKAGALLIHLKDEPLCRIAIPQKVQAYLAFGRPIIIGVRGEASELIKRAKAGIVCEPDDVEGLVNAVEYLRNLPDEQLDFIGVTGRKFYDEHLSVKIGVAQMQQLLIDAAK